MTMSQSRETHDTPRRSVHALVRPLEANAPGNLVFVSSTFKRTVRQLASTNVGPLTALTQIRKPASYHETTPLGEISSETSLSRSAGSSSAAAAGIGCWSVSVTTMATSLRRLHGIVSGELYCSTLTALASSTSTEPSASIALRSAALCRATSSSVTIPPNALTATRRSGTVSIVTSEPASGMGGALALCVGSTNAMLPVASPPRVETSTGIVIAIDSLA
mmetsp:Transcript_5991/g.15753  ORF Transcript_5991/g.15753 Transcript_5991/m.15753 type:complete len:220 (+) Transcript_5991:34-693(+)